MYPMDMGSEWVGLLGLASSLTHWRVKPVILDELVKWSDQEVVDTVHIQMRWGPVGCCPSRVVQQIWWIVVWVCPRGLGMLVCESQSGGALRSGLRIVVLWTREIM